MCDRYLRTSAAYLSVIILLSRSRKIPARALIVVFTLDSAQLDYRKHFRTNPIDSLGGLLRQPSGKSNYDSMIVDSDGNVALQGRLRLNQQVEVNPLY